MTLIDPCTSNHDVPTQIRLLLDKLEGVEVLPHHFDETLVDKLIDFVNFSDQNLIRLLREELVNENLFAKSSMHVNFVLRLLEKAFCCQALDGLSEPFSQLLDALPNFLYQRRPPIVIGSVFRLCTACLPFRQNCNDVLEWAANNFTDSLPDDEEFEEPHYKMTVFVRDKAEELFKRVEDSEELREKLQVLANLFKKETLSDSPFVLNSIARIATVHDDFFTSQWDPRQLLVSLLTSYPTGRGLCPEIYAFLAKHLTIDDEVKRFLSAFPSFATNFYLASYALTKTLTEDAYNFFLSHCTLDQLCALLEPNMERGQLNITEKIKPMLCDSRRTNATFLKRFLELFLDTIPAEQIADVLETCHETVANSTALLSLISTHDASFFSQEICPKLASSIHKIVLDGFPRGQAHYDWEIVEKALETAYFVPTYLVLVEIDDSLLFHENEYVSLAALKCLLGKRPDDAAESCVRVIRDGVHSQPKTLALLSLAEMYPRTREKMLQVLERALEDDDNELRLAAAAVGQNLWMEDSPAVREILGKYVDDYLVGPQIRRLFGHETTSDPDPAVKTLSDILAGLSLVYVDVPDCS